MRRWTKTLLKLAAAVCVAGILAMTGFLWRLNVAPINVDAYIPRIVSFLAPPDTGLTLSVSSAALQWGGFKYPVELSVKDVDLRYKDGKTLLAVPELSMTFWMRSLFLGRVVPSSMTIVRPYVRLKINKDGDLYLSEDAAVQKTENGSNDKKAEKEGTFSPELIAALVELRDDIGRFFLRDAHLVVEDDFHGKKWNVSPINLVYNHSFFNYRIDGNVTADTAGAPLKLKINGHWRRLSEVALTLSVDNFDLKSMRLHEKHDALRGFAVPVSLQGRFILDLKPFLNRKKTWSLKCLKKVALSVTAGKGDVVIAPPVAAAYDIDSLNAEVLWYDAGDKFDVSNFDIRLSSGAGVSGNIKISGLAEAFDKRIFTPVHAVLTADVKNVPLDKLHAYWPGGVSPDEHDWVTTNITVGTATHGTFVLNFDGVKDGGVENSFVNGKLWLKNARVSYLDEMPPVDGVDGFLTFSLDEIKGDLTAGRTMAVSLAEGSKIAFLALQSDEPRMDLDLNLAGPVRDVVHILDVPYLSFFHGTGISETKASGDIAGNFRLNMPLGEAFKGPEQIIIGTTASIKNGALKDVYVGLDIDDIAADIAIKDRSLTLKGGGLLYGGPFSFDLLQSFKPDADVLTRFTAKGTLNNKSRAHWDADTGLLVPPSLDGLLKTDISFMYYPTGVGKLDIGTTLTNMVIDLLDVGWKKPASVVSKGDFHLEIKDGLPQSGAAFALTDETGNALNGTLFFDKQGSLSRGSLAVKTEKTDVTGDYSFKNDKTNIFVSGKSLDLSGFVTPSSKEKRPPAKTAAKTAAKKPSPQKGRPYVITGAIENIWFDDDKAFDMTFLGEYDGLLWRRIKADCFLGEKRSPVGFKWFPDKDGVFAFVLKAADAGDTLRLFNLTETVRGGEVLVNGVFTPDTGKAAGTLSISKFYIDNMPVLTQLLSLSGIWDAVKGEGLAFDTSEVPFEFDGDVWTITDGVIAGPSIGVTLNGKYFKDTGYINLSGSLVPFYTINSLLGKIPLVGALFSDGKGGGLIGPTYTVRGNVSNPEISVDTLSTLAPGMIRRLRNLWANDEDLSKPSEKTEDVPVTEKKEQKVLREEVLSSSTLMKAAPAAKELKKDAGKRAK